MPAWSAITNNISLMTTELNSLANGSGVRSSADYDNTANKYQFARFRLAVTFGANATAGTTCDLYLVDKIDGTNLPDDQNLAALFIGSFNMRAATAHVVDLAGYAGSQIMLPPTLMRFRLVNNSGQAFPASGSTLKMEAWSTG